MVNRLKVSILIIILSFSSNIFSKERRVEFDINKDKRIDRAEVFEGRFLKRVEKDRNGDGKMDSFTNYQKKNIFEIREFDNNYDGKIDRRVVYEHFKDQKVKSSVSVDKNNDGVFEINYFEFISLNQEQDESLVTCYQNQSRNILDDLFVDVTQVLSTNPKGLIATSFGYDVDPQCLQKWGNTFLNDVKDSLKTGLQCLDKLHKDSGKKNVTGALENSFLLSKMLKNERVSLICSEVKVYDWAGTAAHASTSVDLNSNLTKTRGINHPFISINPSYPKKEESLSSEISEVKSTIFHEQLHNLGYRHGDSVEFPYACSDCCFGDDPEKKALGCNICLGDYKNPLDKKYIKDLLSWGDKAGNSSLIVNQSIRYIKENPKDSYGISILAKSLSLELSPVGYDLKERILKENENLPKKERDLIENIFGYYSVTEELKEESKVISDSMYELYYNSDGKAAFSNLESNKEELKKLVAESKLESSTFAKKETVDNLYKVIYEMWVNSYPDDSQSMETYDLYEYLDFD